MLSVFEEWLADFGPRAVPWLGRQVLLATAPRSSPACLPPQALQEAPLHVWHVYLLCIAAL